MNPLINRIIVTCLISSSSIALADFDSVKNWFTTTTGNVSGWLSKAPKKVDKWLNRRNTEPISKESSINQFAFFTKTTAAFDAPTLEAIHYSVKNGVWTAREFKTEKDYTTWFSKFKTISRKYSVDSSKYAQKLKDLDQRFIETKKSFGCTSAEEQYSSFYCNNSQFRSYVTNNHKSGPAREAIEAAIGNADTWDSLVRNPRKKECDTNSMSCEIMVAARDPGSSQASFNIEIPLIDIENQNNEVSIKKIRKLLTANEAVISQKGGLKIATEFENLKSSIAPSLTLLTPKVDPADSAQKKLMASLSCKFDDQLEYGDGRRSRRTKLNNDHFTIGAMVYELGADQKKRCQYSSNNKKTEKLCFGTIRCNSGSNSSTNKMYISCVKPARGNCNSGVTKCLQELIKNEETGRITDLKSLSDIVNNKILRAGN